MKYVVFALVVVLVFIAGPFVLHGVPDTATSTGLAMVSAEAVGTAFGAMLIGSLGLLYKPDRFGGFVVGTSIAALMIFAAGRAESNSGVADARVQSNPTAVFGPPTCDEVADLARGSLEMREMGLSADYAAGVASGIYSTRDPEEVVERVHRSYISAPTPTVEARIAYARTVSVLCLVDEENGLR